MRKKPLGIGAHASFANLRPFVIANLSSEDKVTDCEITGEARQQSFESVEVSHCRMQEVRCAGCTLDRFDVEETEFMKCDLANAKFEQSIFRNATFSGCRLTGASFTQSNFKQVLMKDCKANLASFRFCTFASCRFQHCDFHGADFQGANLSGAVFRDCTLTETQMSQALLHGADVRTCNIDGLKIGIPELQGMVLSHSQFLLVADLVGITVKEMPSESSF